MILTINGQQAALKKGSSIEYVSENRIFTDIDDYNALTWVINSSGNQQNCDK